MAVNSPQFDRVILCVGRSGECQNAIAEQSKGHDDTTQKRDGATHVLSKVGENGNLAFLENLAALENLLELMPIEVNVPNLPTELKREFFNSRMA
jgi:hypothetical protein